MEFGSLEEVEVRHLFAVLDQPLKGIRNIVKIAVAAVVVIIVAAAAAAGGKT